MSTNRGVDKDTKVGINALEHMGALYIEQAGTSDVALARNIALSLTLEVLEKYPERDVILMIDDDMTFTTDDAVKVCKHAKKHFTATAGAYVNQRGQFAGKPISKEKWVMGLAFVAFPAKLLQLLRTQSAPIPHPNPGQKNYAFTWTGEENNQWWSEDYRLTQRLGGCEVLPIAIGHLKKLPMFPVDKEREAELEPWLLKQLGEFNG